MQNTIKLLKLMLISLYITFAALIVGSVVIIIVSIDMGIKVDPVFFTLLFTLIVVGLLCYFIKVLIGWTRGSIEEHGSISARIRHLESRKAAPLVVSNKTERVSTPKEKEQIQPSSSQDNKQHTEKVETETKKEETTSSDGTISISFFDVDIKNDKITLGGDIYKIENIASVSMSYSKVYITIDERKFIIDCGSSSSASKLFSDIYKLK